MQNFVVASRSKAVAAFGLDFKPIHQGRKSPANAASIAGIPKRNEGSALDFYALSRGHTPLSDYLRMAKFSNFQRRAKSKPYSELKLAVWLCMVVHTAVTILCTTNCPLPSLTHAETVWGTQVVNAAA